MNLGRNFVLHAEGRVGNYGESPYSSDQNPEAQVLSRFFRTGELLKGTYTRGRVRLTGAYDHSAYSYATLRYPDGRTADQRYRNRNIDRVSGQVEVALSPSLALYSAVSADKISYPVVQAGSVSQNSSGQQILAGVSFDLAGVMRGMIGAGFTHRDYQAAAQPTVSAFSAQARVDFFPSSAPPSPLQGSGWCRIDAGLRALYRQPRHRRGRPVAASEPDRQPGSHGGGPELYRLFGQPHLQAGPCHAALSGVALAGVPGRDDLPHLQGEQPGGGRGLQRHHDGFVDDGEALMGPRSDHFRLDHSTGHAGLSQGQGFKS
jgi:hypothetical protein